MALALEVVGLTLAQLFHCFDWRLECRDGIQQELNMTEAFGLTMAPRFQLSAVPSLTLQVSL